MDFQINSDLMKPLMTPRALLFYIKKLCLHDVSIPISFYQNWLINNCARMNLGISEQRKPFFGEI